MESVILAQVKEAQEHLTHLGKREDDYKTATHRALLERADLERNTQENTLQLAAIYAEVFRLELQVHDQRANIPAIAPPPRTIPTENRASVSSCVALDNLLARLIANPPSEDFQARAAGATAQMTKRRDDALRRQKVVENQLV
jgi:hypothetical protein